MMLLSLDSSAVTASVALTDGDTVIKSEFVKSGLTHSETLMPMITRVMSGHSYDELDAVAQRVAIEELAALGVERVLTHGGSAGVPIEKALPHLKEILSWANGRLTVLPGGGVTHKNAELVAGELGVSEVHGTRVVPLA